MKISNSNLKIGVCLKSSKYLSICITEETKENKYTKHAMKMARLKCYNKAMRLYVPDPKSKLKKFPTIDNSL